MSHVNSLEDQKRISERTYEENHLLLIDDRIARLRKTAMETGDVNGHSKEMDEVYALERWRKTFVDSNKKPDTLPEIHIETGANYFVLALVAFAIFFVGMVVGNLI